MTFTKEKADELKTLGTYERFAGLLEIVDDTSFDLTHQPSRDQLIRFKDELKLIQQLSIGSKDFAPGNKDRLLEALVEKFDA